MRFSTLICPYDVLKKDYKLTLFEEINPSLKERSKRIVAVENMNELLRVNLAELISEYVVMLLRVNRLYLDHGGLNKQGSTFKRK